MFQFFQTFGFYGFAAWVPTLIARQVGIDLGSSLLYAFIIAVANPFGPLLAMSFADRWERKWQMVGAACGVAIFGVLFSFQATLALLSLFGALITLSNNVLSYAFHSYQTELFPTRIRARAVGFTYSFSRIGTVFAAFIIGFIHAHPAAEQQIQSSNLFAQRIDFIWQHNHLRSSGESLAEGVDLIDEDWCWKSADIKE